MPRGWYAQDPHANPFYGKPEVRELMVVLLQWAALEDTGKCRRGQILTCWEELGEAIGISDQAARRRFRHLEGRQATRQQADRQADRQGILITVVDYDRYYDFGQPADRRADSQPDSSPTAYGRKKEKKKDTLSPKGEELAALWEAHRGRLRGITKLTKERAAKAEARWGETPDPAFWEAAIKRLAQSDFAASGSWATFDWLVKNAQNPIKAFEGNYDNPPEKAGGSGKSLETAKPFKRL